jgi:hypothetical protein
VLATVEAGGPSPHVVETKGAVSGLPTVTVAASALGATIPARTAVAAIAFRVLILALPVVVP